MEKEQILAKIKDIKAHEIFNFICQGKVTLPEVEATGMLDLNKHKAIKKLKVELDHEDNLIWQSIAEKSEEGINVTIRDYTSYISKFPNGIHRGEADDCIAEIITKQQLSKSERESKLRKIKENRNSCRPEGLSKDIESGIISVDDLVNDCNIPKRIVEKVLSFGQKPIKLGITPDSIPSGFTEVYFWGDINSGKTCALAAILKTTESKGYLKTGVGPGLSYLNDLKNIFEDDNIGFLPEGTPIENTQYLPFELKRKGDRHPRSVSMIELSGEIFKCFLAVNEGKDIPAELKPTFQTLTSYLNGDNRKIHFFFIDYLPDANAKLTRTQSDYMSEAAKWIEMNKVFAKKTDAIYLVITKSDLITGYGDDDKTTLKQNINEFLDSKFPAFRRNLKDICVQADIRGGDYEIIPFSIGDVYFTKICELNNEPSLTIIERLFNIKPQKKSVLDFIIG